LKEKSCLLICQPSVGLSLSGAIKLLLASLLKADWLGNILLILAVCGSKDRQLLFIQTSNFFDIFLVKRL
jgi:hypothetical protein